MLKALTRDISRLGEEHDDALRRYEEFLEAIPAKAGNALYDEIHKETQDDITTCKELRKLVRLLRALVPCPRPTLIFRRAVVATGHHVGETRARDHARAWRAASGV